MGFPIISRIRQNRSPGAGDAVSAQPQLAPAISQLDSSDSVAQRIFESSTRTKSPEAPKTGNVYYYTEGMLYGKNGDFIGRMAVDRQANLNGKAELDSFGSIATGKGAWNYMHNGKSGVFTDQFGRTMQATVLIGPPPNTVRTFSPAVEDAYVNGSVEGYIRNEQKHSGNTVIYRNVSPADKTTLSEADVKTMLEKKSGGITLLSDGVKKQFGVDRVVNADSETSYVYLKSSENKEEVRLRRTEKSDGSYDYALERKVHQPMLQGWNRVASAAGWASDPLVSVSPAARATERVPGPPMIPPIPGIMPPAFAPKREATQSSPSIPPTEKPPVTVPETPKPPVTTPSTATAPVTVPESAKPPTTIPELPKPPVTVAETAKPAVTSPASTPATVTVPETAKPSAPVPATVPDKQPATAPVVPATDGAAASAARQSSASVTLPATQTLSPEAALSIIKKQIQPRLDSNPFYQGVVSLQDLPADYRLSDIFAMKSRFDGDYLIFPLAEGNGPNENAKRVAVVSKNSLFNSISSSQGNQQDREALRHAYELFFDKKLPGNWYKAGTGIRSRQTPEAELAIGHLRPDGSFVMKRSFPATDASRKDATVGNVFSPKITIEPKKPMSISWTFDRGRQTTTEESQQWRSIVESW